MRYEDFIERPEMVNKDCPAYKLAEFIETRSDLLTKSEMFGELVEIVDKIEREAWYRGYDDGAYAYSQVTG